MDSLGIAASGLTADSLMLNITANNLANANTDATPTAPAYDSESVVFQAMPDGGVEATGIVVDPAPGPITYDPASPYANAQGDVQGTNVSTSDQMANMLEASTAYAANVTAFNVAKAVAQRAFTI
jgi:flagellar basal-body rod protein FlgC